MNYGFTLVVLLCGLLSVNGFFTGKMLSSPSSATRSIKGRADYRALGRCLHATSESSDLKGISVDDVRNNVYEQLKSNPDIKIPKQFEQALYDILNGSADAAKSSAYPGEKYANLMNILLKEAVVNSKELYNFAPFHRALRDENGVDYQTFGEEFFDICMEKERSALFGQENVERIIEQARAGDNIILLANHQTEPDPYVLRSMFKKFVDPSDELLNKLVFVAGAKVRTDLFSIPFSKGLNLVCINSKKYIDDDPETRPQKVQENVNAVKALGEILGEGGHIIWVAPSGGRDRKSPETNRMAVAPFDAKSVDMFRLLSMKAKKKAHFYPLSMYTYTVLPPPEKVAMEVGERRPILRKPVHLTFGDELTEERVVKTYTEILKNNDETASMTEEEMQAIAKKEGLPKIAEKDVKDNYLLLDALDVILENSSVGITPPSYPTFLKN